MRHVFPLLLLTALVGCQSFAPQPKEPLQTYLDQGNWEDGLAALATWSDPQSAYEKGFLETLVALEKLGQDLNRYGAGRRWNGTAYSPSPFPESNDLVPEPITYPLFRKILQDFHDRLKTASSTLSRADRGDWTVKVEPGVIALDLNGDGTRSVGERLGPLFFGATGVPNTSGFYLQTDVADAQWLAGYTKLLEAALDIVLAYDISPLYHAFVAASFARPEDALPMTGQDVKKILVAAVERGEEARQALLRVIALGRTTWKLVASETDDDHEWLPNPRQTSPALPITEERITEWKNVLDDAEALLEGRMLLPLTNGNGLNVKKLFQKFPDLTSEKPIEQVMAPYVETAAGNRLLSRDRSLWTFFSGQGLLYAFWFN